MPAIEQPSIKSLITQVIRYAKSLILDEKYFNLFVTFTRLFYSHASVTDLKHRTIAALYGMASSHWELTCRKPGVNWRHIRVFNPDEISDGWRSSHTVVEVITRDMPFIVDSMRAEMNRLGLTVHLMVHMGGMTIHRDALGSVTHIAPYQTDEKKNNAVIEAPVYMEIDYQSNPTALEQIEENVERVLHDVQVTVEDWKPMRERVQASIQELSQENKFLPKEEAEESIAFLQWLLDDQFTFLGIRDYEVIGEEESLALRLVKGTG